jgi:hypothetical protein
MQATSAYLNQPCRSLDDVLRIRVERATRSAIGDALAVQSTSSLAIAGGSVPA